ncbi:hypothetical protein BD324DRAFT_653068 [Kockovaella imperatae]|uniref:ubiquitinyl hydrolase 1 n=1 Tax=Kockovaella imperatae TaxID=4999 RepID=A0A1Y1U9U6_9TREE|nr:hypothetical protein BD324DRAFT_653068 [Kockovaella imperatae]ORX34811.1 hypothetical protein BD324DRAFT_653068 [Kockovaella imperatae]
MQTAMMPSMGPADPSTSYDTSRQLGSGQAFGHPGPQGQSYPSEPSPSSHPGMSHFSPSSHPQTLAYPSMSYDPNYYGQQPEGWMPPPQFYPPPTTAHQPQSFQARPPYNGRNFSAAGGSTRYPSQSNVPQPSNPRYPAENQPYQPTFYPQGYQMGGPGPGTMQNGYGGYPVDGMPAYIRGGPSGYAPPFPSADGMDPSQFAKSLPNGGESTDGSNMQSGDAPPYHQHPQLPSIPPPPDQDFRPGQPYPNANPSHQPYPSYYPPGHPYAYGAGVGYHPYLPHQAMYPSFSYDPSMSPVNAPPQSQPSHRQSNGPPSKSLNPAAAGFTFAPSQARSHDNVQIHSDQMSLPSSDRSDVNPVYPTLSHSSQTTLKPDMPNGHADTKSLSIGAIVNGEDMKGINAASAPNDDSNDEASGGLGLEHMEMPQENASTQESSLAASVTLSQSESTPAMSLSTTTPTTPISVQTPKAPSDPLSPSVTTPDPAAPTSNSAAPPPSKLNFVGPTMSGYTSPNATAPTTPSIAQTMSEILLPPSAARQVPAKSVSKSQPAVETLKLFAQRPKSRQLSGNGYALSSQNSIPKNVKTEVVNDMAASSRSSTRRRPLGLPIFVSAGSRTRKSQPLPASASRITLSFGEIGPSTAPVPAAKALEPSRPKTPTPPAPKSKPSSWAALLKPEGATSSTTASTRNVSPIATSTPLSPISDAGHLANPPSTPPSQSRAVSSGTPGQTRSVPPTPASVASGSKVPRAVFSYAGAAAAAATITPQQELVKLLSEGIKGKGKDVRGTLPRGLINTGNMCFANTILQVLVYCPPFAELLEELGKRLKADLARRTPLLEAMIIFLREFASMPGQVIHPPPSGTSTPRSEGRAKERDARNDAFIPENVYDAMKENKRFDSMRRGFQEDAEEYLGFFLNTLHEELLWLLSQSQGSSRSSSTVRLNADGDADTERSIQRPVSPNHETTDDEPWLEVGKKQKTNVVRNTESRETAVSRLFGGTLRSVLHIPGSKDSVTLEPYQPLQLDVDSPGVSSITDALRQLSVAEVVPGVWSPSRGSNVDATKQVYIETFPPALILHLKRFVFDPREMTVVKKFKPVAYGTELVVPPEIISPGRRGASAIKYRLFGVVYHHGNSASGGHYTVSVSRQDAGGWIHFDDESVSTVPVEQVIVSPEEAKEGRSGYVGVGQREKCAYLLFYLRVRA